MSDELLEKFVKIAEIFGEYNQTMERIVQEQLELLNELGQSDFFWMMEKFIKQKPGVDPCNYGYGYEGWKNYRNEQARIVRMRHDALKALDSVWREWKPWCPDVMAHCLAHSYSGRLLLRRLSDGKIALDYCPGQYAPVEYRRAAEAVLLDYDDGVYRKMVAATQAAEKEARNDIQSES